MGTIQHCWFIWHDFKRYATTFVLIPYQQGSLFRQGNVFEKTSRHRLKMLTFSTYDEHPKELQVNHKDGIPGNDDFDNLEWCDNSHNIRHAIEMGLISKQLISVDVKNVLTGETFSAKSISEASSKSGVSIPALHSRLRNPSYLATDGWVIKYNGYDWTALTRTPRSRITNTAVIAWCLKTNTKQKFVTLLLRRVIVSRVI